MKSKPSLSLKMNGKTLYSLKVLGFPVLYFLRLAVSAVITQTLENEVGGALAVSAVSAQASLKLAVQLRLP